MELKYTPGPWEIRGSQYGMTEDVVAIREKGAVFVASSKCHMRSIKENEANARLIAAAPDLYRALELILNSDMAMREEDEGEISTVLSIAREALAKAQGV